MSETMVTLVGNAATAVEHRQTPTGVPVARFRLAATSRRWDRTRECWTDGDTSFYTVRSWRTLADNVAASVAVGEPLVVQGQVAAAGRGEAAGAGRAALVLRGGRRRRDRPRPLPGHRRLPPRCAAAYGRGPGAARHRRVLTPGQPARHGTARRRPGTRTRTARGRSNGGTDGIAATRDTTRDCAGAATTRAPGAARQRRTRGFGTGGGTRPKATEHGRAVRRGRARGRETAARRREPTERTAPGPEYVDASPPQAVTLPDPSHRRLASRPPRTATHRHRLRTLRRPSRRRLNSLRRSAPEKASVP